MYIYENWMMQKSTLCMSAEMWNKRKWNSEPLYNIVEVGLVLYITVRYIFTWLLNKVPTSENLYRRRRLGMAFFKICNINKDKLVTHLTYKLSTQALQTYCLHNDEENMLETWNRATNWKSENMITFLHVPTSFSLLEASVCFYSWNIKDNVAHCDACFHV